jgi:uncharacterized membrane protein YkvA (DUF1232 family)
LLVKVTEKWKQSARKLKQELHGIYLACKDPRTPWYAKALAACVVGYALSPIDLIPDPIPILGYIDDFLLLPLGIAAVRKMIPPVVLAECQLKATEASPQRKRKNWIAAIVIIAVWIFLAIFAVNLIKEYFS